MNPDMFYHHLPQEEQPKWDQAKNLLESIQMNKVPACLGHLTFLNTREVRFSKNLYIFLQITIFSVMISWTKQKRIKQKSAMTSINNHVLTIYFLRMIWCLKKVHHMTGVWKMSRHWRKFHFSIKIQRNRGFTKYRQLPQCFLRTLPSSVWDCSTKILTAKMRAGKISVWDEAFIIYG